MRNPIPTLRLIPRKTIILAITLYQHTLSPDHGPLRHLWRYGYCRHEPTCSDYAVHAIGEHGIIVGSLKTTWRLLGCHPWKKPSPERIMHASHRSSN